MSQTTFPRQRRPALRIAVSAALVCLALTTSPLVAQPKPRVVTSKASPEHTHQLFVGIDLFVPQGTEMLEVRNIVGETTLAKSAAGELNEIDRTTGYRWKLVPKVSDLSATVSDLEYETTYSPASDPQKKWMGRQTNMMNYQQDQLSQGTLMAANLSRGIAALPSQGGQGGPSPEAVERMQAGVNSQIRGHLDEVARVDAITDPDFTAKEQQAQEILNPHDSVRLQFRVSTPTPMAHAFCVALARIRHPNGEIEDINFYKPIGEVGPKPKKVNFLQTGLAPGFEILELKVHLFNNGKELATNLSEKRFQLTTDEARQYLLLDHTANHRGETVPASPVWELAPPELKALDRPGSLDRPLLVNINAKGDFTGFAGSGQLYGPEHEHILRQLVFLPALEDGQAVDSTATINLADYFR
ncbi:hypothetical protein [Actomonas aquatica]|uniref:Secreted protein n=1 Tax=Actomonas aquatica TaxID=2866162 RepID=A0ABZ1C3L5_9BACT|nr:hypothetical protein [Opitutus sp. WL0086]WRQ86091.1 hypothetical protein K1X11_014850 [Opitutus sp. WL0086]